MKKTIRLTESDLMKIVKKVINEQEGEDYNKEQYWDEDNQFNLMKKNWTKFLLDAESEEEFMDRILNLAEFASHRKTRP